MGSSTPVRSISSQKVDIAGGEQAASEGHWDRGQSRDEAQMEGVARISLDDELAPDNALEPPVENRMQVAGAGEVCFCEVVEPIGE